MWRRSGALPSCIFRTATVETMNRRQLLAGGGALALAGAGVTYFGLRQMGSMEEYNASVLATRAALSERPEMKDFIRYATLAASGHNTQPWRFRIGAGRIDILPDFSRRTPVVDPDDHHVFVSLGCAVENLTLAAAARGHRGEIGFEPAKDGSVVFARVPQPPADAVSHQPSVCTSDVMAQCPVCSPMNPLVRTDARRFWDDMRKRFEEVSLSVNPDKTRLLEFGRFAAERRAHRGSENRRPFANGLSVGSALFDAIPKRQSTRADYE